MKNEKNTLSHRKPIGRWLACLAWCCLLAQYAHAQSDSTSRCNRELGILANVFNVASTQSTVGDFQTRNGSVATSAFQCFYLKTNPQNIFKRIAIGMQRSKSDTEHKFEATQYSSTSTALRRSTSLNVQFGMGRMIQSSNRPILSRFRVRLGVGLGFTLPLLTRETVYSIRTDTSGQIIEEGTRSSVNISGGIILSPSLFSHVEFRVFRQCYLGAEWGVGPTLELEFGGPRIDQGSGNPTIQTQNRSIAFNWKGNIGGPSVSLGYSF